MSVASEIAEQLGRVPDVVTLPYGGGGNTRAVARGFDELVGTLPRLHPVEAARRPDTVASAIRITEPVHEQWVHEAIERSGGSVLTVGDDEILAAWKDLRTLEGVFSEPASAAGIAGLAHGSARKGETVVCIVTGHGLKDPAAVDAVREAAEGRAEAMVISDQWVAEGADPSSPSITDERAALVRGYTALRVAVTPA